jgi:TRAP-type C4-dicarboxylate transport system substrate-binding protein
MKSTKLGAIGLAACAAFALGSPAARAAEVKLTAAVFLPTKTIFGAPFARWVKATNEQCAGKVNIVVRGPSAIKAFEQPNALKTGVIDMMAGPPAYYKGMMVEGETQILSNLSAPEQRKSGAWAMLNKLHNQKVNAYYLATYGQGVKFHVYSSKPAGKDGSFKGLTIRATANYRDFLQARGARTINMPPPDVYTALERGAVDGYGWPLWGITDFGWHKLTKFRYDPGFYDVVINILVNLDKWKGLADDQRACLSKMALWLEAEWPKWRANVDAEQKAAQTKAGIKTVDFGPSFRKAAEEVYWTALTKASPDNVKKLRSLLVK